jgi:hypothetical protein
MKTLAYCIALALPGTVIAAETVDQLKDTSASPTVYIENNHGEITIEGWAKNSIQVQGTLDENSEGFIFEVNGDQVKIIVDTPKGWGDRQGNWSHSRGSQLTIKMPTASALNTDAYATDIVVTGITGEMDIESVSGDFRSTGNTSRMDVESVSGDIIIEDHAGIIFASSVSGDIDYSGLATRIEIESVQGDIDVNNQGRLAEWEFNSVSGDIDTRTNTAKTNIEYNAVSGDVDIAFIDNINAVIEVETMSGDIANYITDDRPNEKRWVGNSLSFTVGDGNGDIRISTVSGNVRIK